MPVRKIVGRNPAQGPELCLRAEGKVGHRPSFPTLSAYPATRNITTQNSNPITIATPATRIA
jgi:hypothetical protein